MVNVQTDAFKSLEILKGEQVIRIDQGNAIKFATEDGEVISGILTKISGKGEKTKLQISPRGSRKEEIWSVAAMADDSLEVITEDEEA